MSPEHAALLVNIAGYLALAYVIMCAWYSYRTAADPSAYPTPLKDFLQTTDNKDLVDRVHKASALRGALAADGMVIGLATVLVGLYVARKNM